MRLARAAGWALAAALVLPAGACADIVGVSGIPGASDGGLADGTFDARAEAGGDAAHDSAVDAPVCTCAGGVCQAGVCTCTAPQKPCNGVCATGMCKSILASGQNAPFFVAVDSTNVYWTDNGTSNNMNLDGAIVTVPLTGGTPTTLASGQHLPLTLAVDATNVYWTNAGTSANNYTDGTVMTVPKSGALGGASPTTIATGQVEPSDIVVDSTSVYWLTYSTAGRVMRATLGSFALTTLASGLPSPEGIAIDATRIYWAQNGTKARSFADGALMSMPIGGGTPTTIASKQAYAAIVAALPLPSPPGQTATQVFWTNVNSGTVVRAPAAGLPDGGAPTVLASGYPELSVLALDATNVYFTDTGSGITNGTVLSVPRAGGTVTTLATGQGESDGLAVDATSVYWADHSAGTIVRLTLR